MGRLYTKISFLVHRRQNGCQRQRCMVNGSGSNRAKAPRFVERQSRRIGIGELSGLFIN